MSDPELRKKCKQLIARRDSPPTPWFYITRDWPRQLFFLFAYIAVSAALWVVDFRLASVAFFAFFVGRVVRDIRWWKALAKEWPSTEELLDWPRIEAIAGGDDDGDAPVA